MANGNNGTPKKKGKGGVAALAVVLVVLVVLALFIWNGMNKEDAPDGLAGAFQTSTGTGETPQPAPKDGNIVADETVDLSLVEFEGQKYKQKDNVVNVLLLGIDSDAERVKNKQGWRSDMIMLMSVDMDTNHITLTSVPRDSRATVYHVDEAGNITKEVVEKLNHAYAYGGGPNKKSAENAMYCTTMLLECDGRIDVPIDYYISIDLDGVPKLANEMGGVPVTLEQSVPDVGKKGETVTLKGETTRKYLQNRYDMDDGETTRQRHEQLFIKSLATELKDMGAASAAPSLYDTFIKFMRTNLTLDQLVEIGKVLDNTSIGDMTFNVMTNGAPEVIDGVWYYRCSQDEILGMMLEAQYNKV